jgi:hypothetical protein
MKRIRLLPVILLLAAAVTAAQGRQEAAATPTIAAKTAGMQKLDGYFPLYWDAKAGKVWLEIDRWGGEFLYVVSLPAGLGSNDVGLDRGQLGADRVVRFERSGPRVMLVEPNYGFRAASDNPDERAAVRNAFAESVLWGFDVAAEEGEHVLVDATNFYLRDAHDAAGALRRAQQGQFRLDATRSAFYLPRTKNFPKNTEVEVTLTFAGDDPGGFVRSVVPTPQAVTLRQHHSFVELPPPGFQPRVFDSRAGFFGINYYDFAAPIGSPLVRRFIARHRLEKKDPAARVSEAVRPIVYYLDRGTPEPVRSALLDGARWWNQAFEAAGYRDAFRVEMLPEGADPMDIRYNMIVWVHRSTRGWSYGSTVTDPRTGEIIKGQVSLDSLRVRQDYLIFEGLLAPYEAGRPAADKALEAALARLRQLAAHEIGHTLGLAHNYSASTAGRSSVMDYPHPMVKLGADGAPDLSDAYATGIGEWDKIAIRYGYSDFPAGTDERAALEAILQDGIRRGLCFLTDQDARPPGSASPAAHLWDNGPDAVEELERVKRIRAAALARFGANNIPEGAPLSSLEDALVPVYLFHRYQLEAAAKVLAGADYRFARRGDGQKPLEIVPPAQQVRALEALLGTLKPEFLALPESVIGLIPPRAYGYGRNRELFRIRTGMTFDPVSAAETSAHHTLGLLLHPDRAARLAEYHARNARNPGVAEVVDRLIAATWRAPQAGGFAAEIQRAVNIVALYHLMALAANDRAAPQARAIATHKLAQLKTWVAAQSRSTTLEEDWRAHYVFASSLFRKFEDNPKELPLPRPLEPPDGQPIGGDSAIGTERRCDWD